MSFITFLNDGMESIVAALAISKVGCVRVPIDTRLNGSGIESIVKQVEPNAWITDEANADRVPMLSDEKSILVVPPAHRSVPHT